MSPLRRRVTTLAAAVALALALPLAAGCEPAEVPPGGAASGPAGSPGGGAGRQYPSSMAALGDSLTAGYGACLAPSPCPYSSWATGESTQINSHYLRILRANPAMRGQAHNLAEAKATSADLPGQASAASQAGVEYVTILIGANDACHGGIDEMTEVATFRARIDEALTILTRQAPKARVYVLSIPNVYRVWEVAHTNRAAAKVWSLGICPALLANATSTAAADVSRRRAFRERIEAYDRQLSAACATRGRHCRYDGGAVHSTDFAVKQLYVGDFFHPNAAGQQVLARVSYPERFTW